MRSPTLDLRIGSSRLRVALHAVLCVLVADALWELYCRGYPLLCLLLALLAPVLLLYLRRDPLAGAGLYFQQGRWFLEKNGARRAITLSRRCVVTPWVIYLAFTGPKPGSLQHGWLYFDAVHAQQWRRLRVRLTLLH